MSPPTDLVGLTAELVAIPSVSRSEGAVVDWLVAALSGLPWLQLTRVGDNLVARSDAGCRERLVLAGHTDTVPPDGNAQVVMEPDRVAGVGSTDMKGGLAVMVALARSVAQPSVDVTYVFYAREEVASSENGLLELCRERPDLLAADAAILGEPTGSVIEAGCQGTMRVRITLVGERAHTARPWMGRNAIHRVGSLVTAIAQAPQREPVIGGCTFHEALQVVGVQGGDGGNVVPDRVEIVVNHRFAPDRTPAEAEGAIRSLVDPWMEAEDSFEVSDLAPAAMPGVDHPLLSGLQARNHLEVKAKLGWTDVARFAALGVPAINFGPGDPSMAHTRGEFVTRRDLDVAFAALDDLLRGGGGSAASP